jgi:hypothetical protein
MLVEFGASRLRRDRSISLRSTEPALRFPAIRLAIPGADQQSGLGRRGHAWNPPARIVHGEIVPR